MSLNKASAPVFSEQRGEKAPGQVIRWGAGAHARQCLVCEALGQLLMVFDAKHTLPRTS
jgi:hypothetical protein